MRILILNWRDIKHPRAGGAELRLHKVYEPLVAQGHEVILYSCAFPGCKSEEIVNGIEVRRLGTDWNFALLCLLKLRGWVKKHQPDVVVEDFNKLAFCSPLVYRGPLLIQMHHLWKNSIFREASLPVALTVWGAEQLLRSVYRKCRFCVVSESTKEELVGMGPKPEQISVIYNGSEPKEFQAVVREPFILWLGRLQKYKGVLDACEAFSRIADEYPEYKLVIAGDGPFRPQVEHWIQQNSLSDRIEMRGLVSPEEKEALLQRCAFLVQSSYKEGWGLTVIEANVYGTPVLANNAPGLCESVRDRETGLLYDFCSIGDCAAKMGKLINYPELRENYGRNAIDWAKQFDWEEASQQTLVLLKDLASAEL